MELNEGLLTPNSPGSLIEIEGVRHLAVSLVSHVRPLLSAESAPHSFNLSTAEQKAGIRPAWSLSRKARVSADPRGVVIRPLNVTEHSRSESILDSQ